MDELNILYLTDNNYATFAGVSMTSLFINNKDISKITVYIIDDNISSENKHKMVDTAKKYQRDIVFMDLTKGVQILKEMHIPKYRNSYTTYLKLFAFDLLPYYVHRIFFIDSDTVIVGSLKEMISIDMQDYMIGAVQDGISQAYKTALGYASDDRWYNMGVMLVDVDKWKQYNAQEKILQQLQIRQGYIAVDQDLLNITQHGNIMTLNPKFNSTPHHYVFSDKHFRRAFEPGGFYDEQTLKDAETDVRIRHFERFMGESAWHKNTVHPYAHLFDQYLKESLWFDYEKTESKLTSVLKIERFLYRILPANIFVYIYGFGFKWYLLKLNNKLKNMKGIENIT